MNQNHMPHGPVIIIGMHRSGTSMITRLLESMGLFVGHIKEQNHEARFFLDTDAWLFRQCSAAWDHPAPIRFLLGNRELRALVLDYIRRYLFGSPRFVRYTGWTSYLRYRTPYNLPHPWGWKSPWSTYTLPIWLDLFPDARVIHIYRHGVDVANSLRERVLKDEKTKPFLRSLYYRLPILHGLRRKRGGFVGSVRCYSLEGGFSLWEEYFAEARAHVQLLNDRAIELKYEDFLSDPAVELKRLADFCALPATPNQVQRSAERVRRDRAYAYHADQELRAFAAQVHQRLAAFGY